MMSQECPSQQARFPVFTFFQQTWCRLRYFSRRYKEWLEIKEQHRLLLSMEDRMLNDIGLSRADAVRLTKGFGFFSYLFESGKKKKRS